MRASRYNEQFGDDENDERPPIPARDASRDLRAARCAGPHPGAVLLADEPHPDEALTDAAECFRKHKDLIIAASGSSRHAGLAAEIMLEDAAGLSVDVEYASEYITRSTNTKRDPAVLVISQSGETADTLAALREAKQRKHPTLAVTNVEDSSMASEADLYLPTLAGVERAIPATKSFTAQLLVLRLLSLEAADARGTIDAKEMERQLAELWEIPPMIERQLDGWRELTERLAARYSSAKTLALPRPRDSLRHRSRGRAEAEGVVLHARRGLPLRAN